MQWVTVLFIVGISSLALGVQATDTENAQDNSATDLKNQATVSSTTLSPSQSSSSQQPAGAGDKVALPPCRDTTGHPKGKDCTREYKPVCSSSGQTYNNQCEFENAQMRDPKLTMTRAGSCQDKS